jgi:glutamate--cysteine ligase
MSTTMNVSEAERAHLLARPLKDTRPAELAKLFAGGAKLESSWKLGLEIELTPYRTADRRPLEHPDIARLFASLARIGGYTPDTEPSSSGPADPGGVSVGMHSDGQVVSLEPGGQVEFATRPFRALKRLYEAVDHFTEELRRAGSEQGVEFWAIGHHPFETKETIPRMPKARYAAMRRYLASSGSRGLDMMHLTGSVQCAVDFSDEANLADKVRAAARISPFLSALTASSPFTAGKPNGMKSERYAIWFDVDAPRCGIWPEMVDEQGLTFERYVQHALAAPPIFFMRDGKFRPVLERRPFASYGDTGFEDTTVTIADLLDHLTTMFPEIRVKSYIELRGADCLPPADAVAIAGFWRALLDNGDARAEVTGRLRKMGYPEIRALQPDVARLGLDAVSPAGPVREIALWLSRTAYESLTSQNARDCAECVLPLVERAERGRSMADDLIDRYHKSGIEHALELCRV